MLSEFWEEVAPRAFISEVISEIPARVTMGVIAKRLILPYLILAGALFEGNPVKICHCNNLPSWSVRIRHDQR